MAIPVKIFPYMACAKPVVLANKGEIAELVRGHNTGICVPPGDAESFSHAILKFYKDRELCRQCGDNGYRLAHDEFAMEKLAKKLENILLDLSPPHKE